MFGQVLTYGAYHLALYLCTALAWGALGLYFLLQGTGFGALIRCCGMFAIALSINGVMLLLDIRRTLDHHQVEAILWLAGVALPCLLLLTCRTGFVSGKKGIS